MATVRRVPSGTAPDSTQELWIIQDTHPKDEYVHLYEVDPGTSPTSLVQLVLKDIVAHGDLREEEIPRYADDMDSYYLRMFGPYGGAPETNVSALKRRLSRA